MSETMKTTPIEHLFYSDGGLFHQHTKKVKKAIDNKQFDALASMGEKVQHLKKSGHVLKPKVTQIVPSLEKALKFKEEGNKLFKAQYLKDIKSNRKLRTLEAENTQS